MKLFDIKVHTSDREFDVALRNLTIIRASEIVHKISVAGETLIRSIKRLVIPGKFVIQPLIRIRSIKSLRQRANVAVNALLRIRSFKRITADDGVKIAAAVSLHSIKKIRDSTAWRVVAEALLGSKKPIVGDAAISVDADMRIQKVRKRRLGEVSLVRLADMESMTLDELDYIVEGG